MPKKTKKPTEWTTEEAERKLFPKKVVEEIHRVAEGKPEKQPERSSRSKSST